MLVLPIFDVQETPLWIWLPVGEYFLQPVKD